MHGLWNNRLAPAGAEAFSPRQAAPAARPWVSISPKDVVAPVGAKACSIKQKSFIVISPEAAFAPTGATAIFDAIVIPRRRGFAACRGLKAWAPTGAERHASMPAK